MLLEKDLIRSIATEKEKIEEKYNMTLEEVKLFLVQGSIVVKTGAASEGTPNGKKRPSSKVSFGDNVKISLSKVHQLP